MYHAPRKIVRLTVSDGEFGNVYRIAIAFLELTGSGSIACETVGVNFENIDGHFWKRTCTDRVALLQRLNERISGFFILSTPEELRGGNAVREYVST